MVLDVDGCVLGWVREKYLLKFSGIFDCKCVYEIWSI